MICTACGRPKTRTLHRGRGGTWIYQCKPCGSPMHSLEYRHCSRNREHNRVKAQDVTTRRNRFARWPFPF